MYFDGVKNLDELKARYRRLAMKHHPDRGGDPEIMKAVNNEHDNLFEILKKQHNATADENHQTTETAEEFRDILNILLRLDGLNVELCGSWLWISGETKKHSADLKKSGCFWASKKKMWYWRHPENAARHSRHSVSMNRIRSRYGSQLFTADGQEKVVMAGA